jgi:hypothetical protein
MTALLKEGCGIRSIGRLLSISNTTVLRRIISIAKKIGKPFISFNKTYEVDEMRTFYKSKTRLLWIVYAFIPGRVSPLSFEAWQDTGRRG